MKRRTFLKGVVVSSTALPVFGCSVLSGGYRPKEIVPKKTFGKTGIEISALGFGSHLTQELVKKPKLRDRMIKTGFEGGINTFDVYDHSHYKQFEPMGKSVRDFRKEVIISLCAVKPTNEMQAEIDDALKKFFTDYIDLYRNYVIDDDRMNILEKNKKAGKIRYIGVVSHDTANMTRYLDDYHDILDYVMIIYNFHHNIGRFTNMDKFPSNEYSALIPRCEEMGLGIIGIKPIGSDDMTRLAKKNGFFKDRKANVARAMLRYSFQKNEIDCTMPAINSMGELKDNLEAIYNPAISSYEKDLLDRLSALAASTKSAYLRPHYRWLEKWATRMA